MNVAFEAMKAGALDVIGKPMASRGNGEVWAGELIAKIKALAGVQPRAIAPGRTAAT
jgi:chemotaxis response regulator CheB